MRDQHSSGYQRRKSKLVEVPVLVTRDTARDVGLDLSSVKTRPYRRPVLPGVHVHPARAHTLRLPQWVSEHWLEQHTWVAALQLRRPDIVLSHLSAARFYGWPVKSQHPWFPIDVTPQHSNSSARGFHFHRVRELPHSVKWGVTGATDEEVLRQISRALSEDELVMVVDALCGPWSGSTDQLLTPERLAAYVRRDKRFSGRRKLERAVGRARLGVGSPRETWLRLQIIAAGLPEPVVGHAVETHLGVLHPDLAYVERKVAVEYEGDHHRTDSWQWSHDLEREAAFRTAGWTFIRVAKHMPIARVMTVIAHAITSH